MVLVLVEADADAHPSLEVLPVWWQDRAACAGVDPEVFFPSAGHDQTAEARAVCSTCPVLHQCRTTPTPWRRVYPGDICSGSLPARLRPSGGSEGKGEGWASGSPLPGQNLRLPRASESLSDLARTSAAFPGGLCEASQGGSLTACYRAAPDLRFERLEGVLFGRPDGRHPRRTPRRWTAWGSEPQRTRPSASSVVR